MLTEFETCEKTNDTVNPEPLPEPLTKSDWKRLAKVPWTEDERPWKRLTAAVLEQAVFDWRWIQARGGVQRLQERKAILWRRNIAISATKEKVSLDDALSCVKFFNGRRFVSMCEVLGIDPEALLDAIGFKKGEGE
jgi:hypothetical protein